MPNANDLAVPPSGVRSFDSGQFSRNPLKARLSRRSTEKPKARPCLGTDRIEVRHSKVHGRGVYATKPIPKKSRIIEYIGKRMPWDVASESEDRHTFLFGLTESNDVINAAVGGNESRWINHSCQPNCEAIEEDEERVFIYALRKILPGEELFYDYGLQVDEPRTKKVEREHACHCGAANCRGTLLAEKD